MIIRERLVRLVQDMIRIRSENPPGDEVRIAGFVKKELQRAKLNVKVYEFKRNRPNVLAFLRGRTDKTLAVLPHLDTVPAGSNWKHDPFAAEIKGGRVYGRGATDCKSNLAIAIEAIRSLCEENVMPGCNVVFAATADEETGSRYGLMPLLEKNILCPDSVVVLDSDDFNIITSQKGLMHFKIKIAGKSAHGAYPQRGINAIELASRIICKLKDHRFKHKAHPLLKGPTVNIGTIKGGEKVNIVADFCEFEVDLRYLPGSSSGRIMQDIRRIIRRYAREFKIEIDDVQRPYSISRDHPLVRRLISAAREVKVRAKIKGSEGATVITFFQKSRIPAVSFGCGSPGCAHSSDEYVKLDNLYKGARILEEFLTQDLR